MDRIRRLVRQLIDVAFWFALFGAGLIVAIVWAVGALVVFYAFVLRGGQ